MGDAKTNWYPGMMNRSPHHILRLSHSQVYATAMDKRDYKRYQMEIAETKWGETVSPLFKQATTEYVNPLFVSGERSRSRSIVSRRSSSKVENKVVQNKAAGW